MLCTSCSKAIKPVVAFDIDGTLGDYHNTFRRFCALYHGRQMPSRPWDGEGEFEDYLGLTKQEYREAKLAYRQGGNKRWMPMYPGANRICRRIRSSGVELWVATTRPWQRLDNIDPDTRYWLDRHGIEYDGLLYGDDKYEQLCDVVDKGRVLAVVDDLPEHIMTASELGLPFILRINDHNAWAAYSTSSGDLNKIEQIIKERVDNWYA